MNEPVRIHPLARIPPPLAYAAAFLVGWLVQRSAWPGAGGVLRPWEHDLGGFVGVAGVLLAISAALLFARNRTTIVPHGKPTTLVIRGPFRLTRNPMYVSLTLVYVGLAVWLRAWVALALLPLPVGLVNGIVIPMEEARLRSVFGEAYDAYMMQVGRWL